MNSSSDEGARFAGILQALQAQHADALRRLKNGDPSALARKLELEDAVRCLVFCRAHGITSAARVTEIPETLTRTPSSEYRLMEDHETEDRSAWTALKTGGAEIRASPGMLLVDRGRWPAGADGAQGRTAGASIAMPLARMLR